jgi:Coenzyme PQQ synthesis protein D (PqqD)
MFVPKEDNSKMKDTRKPIARCENIVVQEMPEETLVYDLTINKAFCLNQTAALVWKNCDGQRNVTEIAQILQNSMKSPVSDDLVWLAIDQLSKDNLLEGKPEVPVFPTNGMSRREAVRRIGLASAIVLPLVAALTVPSAAYAANSCAGACTTLGQNPCNGSAACTCLGMIGSLTCQ